MSYEEKSIKNIYRCYWNVHVHGIICQLNNNNNKIILFLHVVLCGWHQKCVIDTYFSTSFCTSICTSFYASFILFPKIFYRFLSFYVTGPKMFINAWPLSFKVLQMQYSYTWFKFSDLTFINVRSPIIRGTISNIKIGNAIFKTLVKRKQWHCCRTNQNLLN